MTATYDNSNPSSNPLIAGFERTAGARRLRYLVAAFVAFCFLPLVARFPLLHNLFTYLQNDSTWAYIPLMPVVSAYLIYMWRDAIFKRMGHAWKSGSGACILAILCFSAARIEISRLVPANQASLLVFGFVLFWIGGFLIFFGADSFRLALFPLLFLLFTIPIPDPPLSSFVSLLQEGSSRCAAWMFELMGVPFLKNGFDFALPGFTIRVAEECSGIRSTLALIITAVLAARLFLRRPGNRLLLCLIVVPISIVKNGFRIAFLSTMALYVSPAFLKGPLHYHGGTFFFALALIPIYLVFRVLKGLENGRAAVSFTSRNTESALNV